MFNINPFEKQPGSLVVDEVMGDSYRIVKAVYCELDSLKKIIESDNLQFIVEHFPDIQKILLLSKEIKEISSKLEVIIKSPEYAENAQRDAQLAKEWAIKMDGLVENQDHSAKWYANEVAKKHEEIKKISKLINDTGKVLVPIENQIKILAGSIEEITTTVDNIAELKRIYKDLNTDHYIETSATNIGAIKEAVDSIPIFKNAITIKNELNSSIQDASKLIQLIEKRFKELEDLRTSLIEYVDHQVTHINEQTRIATDSATIARESIQETQKNAKEAKDSEIASKASAGTSVETLNRNIKLEESTRINQSISAEHLRNTQKYSLSAEASAGTAVNAALVSKDAEKKAKGSSEIAVKAKEDVVNKAFSVEATSTIVTKAAEDIAEAVGASMEARDYVEVVKKQAEAIKKQAEESVTVSQANKVATEQKALEAKTSAGASVSAAQQAREWAKSVESTATQVEVAKNEAGTHARKAKEEADGIKGQLDNYMPKSGGSFTGARIQRNVDNEELLFSGGKGWGYGSAGLDLYGKDAESRSFRGAFVLKAELEAGDGTRVDLRGFPDKTLTWNNNPILTTNIQSLSLENQKQVYKNLLLMNDSVLVGKTISAIDVEAEGKNIVRELIYNSPVLYPTSVTCIAYVNGLLFDVFPTKFYATKVEVSINTTRNAFRGSVFIYAITTRSNLA